MAEHFNQSIARLHGACTYLSLQDRPVKERLRLAMAGLSAVHPEDMPNSDLKRRWYLMWFALTQPRPSQLLPDPAAVLGGMTEALAERVEAEILAICREWTAEVTTIEAARKR